MDDTYHPSVGRHALTGEEEVGKYDARRGSTMRELLRVRRRASRFGGADRQSGSPHAQRHFGIDKVPGLYGRPGDGSPSRGGVGASSPGRQGDEALLRELMRRSKQAPEDAAAAQGARAAGAWPLDPGYTRPTTDGRGAGHGLGSASNDQGGWDELGGSPSPEEEEASPRPRSRDLRRSTPHAASTNPHY